MPHKDPEKKNAYQRKYRKAYYARPENKIKTWERGLKSNYGMSPQQYYDMLANQGGVCEICKGNRVPVHRLTVDHCHTTGKIRGLLCVLCNSGLGQAGDDVKVLEQMIKYLKKYQGE